MVNGYKIFWTKHALNELASTYEYLEQNFSSKELRALSIELERILHLVSKNPKLFPLSSKKGYRRVVVKKYNTLYYIVRNGRVEILSFYSNRQKPFV